MSTTLFVQKYYYASDVSLTIIFGFNFQAPFNLIHCACMVEQTFQYET